jgi:ribosome-associated protein
MADDSARRPFDDAPEAGERPSKSQRKRDMHALQDLGAELAALSAERLARIECRTRCARPCGKRSGSPARGKRRRQLQYIGRLMRDIEPAPIRAALDALNGVSAVETARQHRLERLRERLLEDESVLTEIGADHPGADLSACASCAAARCTSAKPASRRAPSANCSACCGRCEDE